jgi:23S rRNA (uracil1939-C5)-methyltransferase
LPDSPATLDVTIDRLGGLGDGMAHVNGRPLLVPKSAPGDRLRVRITGTLGEQDYGEIVDILSPSAHRVSAPCPHFSTCGSCLLQHLNPETYRAFKQRRLSEALARAGYADVVPDALISLPAASRRRASFRLMRDAQKRVQLAYAAPRSHRLTPIDACPILAPMLHDAWPALRTALQLLTDPLPRAIQLTAMDTGIDVILDEAKSLPQSLIEAFIREAGVTRLSLRQTETLRIAVQGTMTLTLGAYTVSPPPGAFLQASAEGQQALTDIALNATQGAKRIADLFCGIGTYSLPLAARAEVSAYELDPAMIAALKAARSSVRADMRNLFRDPLDARELRAFDAVILNPPRAGAKEQCRELAKSAVSRIAMISCNPATFARDAATLREGGYRLASAVGVDQFVWSEHLEIAAVFVQERG